MPSSIPKLSIKIPIIKDGRRGCQETSYRDINTHFPWLTTTLKFPSFQERKWRFTCVFAEASQWASPETLPHSPGWGKDRPQELRVKFHPDLYSRTKNGEHQAWVTQLVHTGTCPGHVCTKQAEMQTEIPELCGITRITPGHSQLA